MGVFFHGVTDVIGFYFDRGHLRAAIAHYTSIPTIDKLNYLVRLSGYGFNLKFNVKSIGQYPQEFGEIVEKVVKDHGISTVTNIDVGTYSYYMDKVDYEEAHDRALEIARAINNSFANSPDELYLFGGVAAPYVVEFLSRSRVNNALKRAFAATVDASTYKAIRGASVSREKLHRLESKLHLYKNKLKNYRKDYDLIKVVILGESTLSVEYEFGKLAGVRVDGWPPQEWNDILNKQVHEKGKRFDIELVPGRSIDDVLRFLEEEITKTGKQISAIEREMEKLEGRIGLGGNDGNV